MNLFTIAVLVVSWLSGGIGLDTLINEWFSFFKAEILALAGITVSKTTMNGLKEISLLKKDKKEEDLITMDENLFQIFELGLRIALLILTYYLAPPLKDWVIAHTTPKQRKEGTYWTKVAIMVAEDYYEDKGSGLGPLKKEYVIKWLNDKGIKFTVQQLDGLIDLIVKKFNENGWPFCVLK